MSVISIIEGIISIGFSVLYISLRTAPAEYKSNNKKELSPIKYKKLLILCISL